MPRHIRLFDFASKMSTTSVPTVYSDVVVVAVPCRPSRPAVAVATHPGVEGVEGLLLLARPVDHHRRVGLALGSQRPAFPARACVNSSMTRFSEIGLPHDAPSLMLKVLIAPKFAALSKST